MEEVVTQSADPKPHVFIGGIGYYTVKQLAEAIGVPEYHIVRAVKERGLTGRKIGKVYLISADEFHEWIKTGHFD